MPHYTGSPRSLLTPVPHVFLISSFTANFEGYDTLHKLYPDLIKRLDDRSDAIRLLSLVLNQHAVVLTPSMGNRLLTLDVWAAYLPGLTLPSYDGRGLYQAHASSIYSGLLVHLDDSNTEVQEKTFAVLAQAAPINPALLAEKIQVRSLLFFSAEYF